MKFVDCKDVEILQVNDEGYSMFTILVDGERVDELRKLIKKLHDEYYEDEGLQYLYGGYYEYIVQELSEMENIILLEAPEILEL